MALGFSPFRPFPQIYQGNPFSHKPILAPKRICLPAVLEGLSAVLEGLSAVLEDNAVHLFTI
ncbi:MAG: hypothetical protein U9M90_04810 [Patescibacteria group bacterium]|nr:hypothetical protein [Patescibacteria group bacterium]